MTEEDLARESRSQRQLQQQQRQRSLQSSPAVQKRSVLLVRIRDARAPSREDAATEADITETLFRVLFLGRGNDDSETYPSVAEQMRLCSNGRIELEATPFGVLTVTVAVDDDDAGSAVAWRQAAAEVVLTQLIGTQDHETPYEMQMRRLAHHVAVILPDTFTETDPEFRATGELENSMSTFAPSWSLSLSAYMHEFVSVVRCDGRPPCVSTRGIFCSHIINDTSLFALVCWSFRGTIWD